MATIEVLINSRFSAEGFNEAKARVQSLAADIADSVKGFSDFGAPMGQDILSGLGGEAGIANTAALAQNLGLASAQLAEMTRQVVTLGGAGITEEILEASGAFEKLSEEEKKAAREAAKVAQASGQATQAQEEEVITIGKVIQGLQSKKAKVDAVAAAMQNLTKLNLAEILEIGGTGNIDQFTQNLRELSARLREVAEIGRESLGPEVAAAFIDRANAVDAVNRRYGDLTKVEREEAAAARENAQAQGVVTQSLKERLEAFNKLSSVDILERIPKEIKGTKDLNRFIEQQVKAYQKLAEQQRRLGNFGLAARMEKQAENFKRAAREAGGLSEAERKATERATELAAALKKLGIDSSQSAADVRKELNKTVEALKEQEKAAKSADEALKLGEKVREVEGLRDSIDNTAKSVGQFGQETGILGTIMTSTFNQLGFVMFITENTIKSITNKIKLLFDTIKEGGKIIESYQALDAVMQRVGGSAGKMVDEIQESSRGIISQADSIASLTKIGNQLGDAGLNVADFWARGSLAIALAGGNSQNTTEAFNQLVTVAAKATARFIEINGVFIDLSGALDKIKDKTEEYGRELTLAERQAIFIAEINDQLEIQISNTEDLVIATQNLVEAQKTAEDSWTAVKTAFSFFADSAIGALGAIGVATGEVNQQSLLLKGNLPLISQGILALGSAVNVFRDMKSALAGVGDILLGIGALGAGVAIALTAMLGSIIQGFREMGDVAEAALKLDFSQMRIELSEVGETAANTAAALLDLPSIITERFQEVRKELRLALGIFDETHIGDEVQVDTSFFDQLIAATQNAIDFLESEDRQFLKNIEDINEQHGETLTKIWQDFGDAIIEIEKKKNKQIEKLKVDHISKMQELDQNLADKLEDINADETKKISRLEEDFNLRREKAKKDSAKRKEKIEKDHQRKIKDIERRFELARLKALIDRDARALFEAEERRRLDLEKAKENAEEKKNDEVEKLKETIDELNAQEELRKRRAREDAEERRRDAQDAWAKQVQDAVLAMMEMRDKIKEQQEEQVAEANEKREEDLKNAEKAKKKRIKQLTEEFRERKLIEQLQTRILKIEAAKQKFEQIGKTNSLITELERQKEALLAYAEIWKQVLRDTSVPLPGAPGGGTGPPPPPGGGPPPPGDPSGCDFRSSLPITEGTGCLSSLFGGGVICDSTGKKWKCINNRFVPLMGAPSSFEANQLGTGIQGTTGGLFGATGGGGLMAGGGTGGARRIPVVIQATGDDTLEAIFKSLSYEAFVEIME
jgi:hypothetical protein